MQAIGQAKAMTGARLIETRVVFEYDRTSVIISLLND